MPDEVALGTVLLHIQEIHHFPQSRVISGGRETITLRDELIQKAKDQAVANTKADLATRPGCVLCMEYDVDTIIVEPAPDPELPDAEESP